MAQIYPVTVNTTLVPPQSTYLSDFTTPGSEKLKLIIQLNDFNEPNYDVRLRISITSSEASLVTSENFQPVPLTLYPGPNVLTGSQLADYLDLNNLNLSGVDRQQLQQTSSLPEGYYTFCVQVFDYRRQDVALSSENCNSAYLRKNNPPIPVQPVCNGTIAYSASQNIFFNWQSNADPLIQAQYELKIVDVLEGVSPNDAINGASTPILDNQLVTGTSFLYGPAQVDLEKGHTYAYQIRAFDPLGLTTFENDGLSEVCWFTYGVAGLGYIQLTNPQDNYIFTKTDNLTFRWQGPDNVTPGQQLYYRYRFVEMHDGQTKEEAMLYNAPWADEESNIAHNISSYAMSLAAMLPYDKTFAWQVEAYTDGVLTASSEIWIFSTPKEFDKFRIGDYTVFVNTCNGDLKNFSGTGKIDIEGNGVMTDIQYAGLEIVKSGPSLVVLEGNINSPVENMFMDLDNGDNGKTQFEVKAIKIGRATDFQMNLTGRVKWRLPHPTTVPEPIVYSEIKDVKYIDYSLVSYLNFQETNFDLLDPFGFNIRFSPSSTFLVKDKEVRELKMNGLLSLPANLIKAGNGSRVAIPFEGADNPYYFTNTQVFGVGIRIANNVAVTANPKSVIFDLSEEKSPETASADPFWKGVAFSDFDLQLPTDLDGSGQLKLKDAITNSYASSDAATDGWVDARGLTLKAAHQFTTQDTDYGFFNTFPGQFYNYSIEIEDNRYNTGEFHGFIHIPVLNETKEFAYTVPLNESGFQTGYLDQDLNGVNNTFSKDDPLTEMKLTARQGYFKDKDHLVLTVDMDWKGLSASMNNVNNFKVWGNNQIGFNYDGGQANLQLATNGTFTDYNFTAHSVEAKTTNGAFSFGVKGSINYGSGITGDHGAPDLKVLAGKVAKTGVNKAVDELAGGYISTDWTGYGKEAFGEHDTTRPDIIPYPIKIRIPNVLSVDLDELGFIDNDPDYGKVFVAAGKFNLDLVKSFPPICVEFKMGTKDKVEYWYFSIEGAGNCSLDNSGSSEDEPDNKSPQSGSSGESTFANEPSVLGDGPSGYNNGPNNSNSDISNPLSDSPGHDDVIKAGQDDDGNSGNKGKSGKMQKIKAKLGIVELTGLGGRVYHHMSHNDVTNVLEADYVPDGAIEYGAFLKVMGEDDKYEGMLIKLELGMEMTGANGSVQTVAVELDGKHLYFDLDEKLMEQLEERHVPGTDEIKKAMDKGVNLTIEGFHSTGSMIYNVPQERFIGDFDFTGVTGICGDGHGHLDVDGIKDITQYKFGSRDDKWELNIGCAGVTFMGYVEGNNDRASMGLGAGIGFGGASPWIDVKLIKFRGRADFHMIIGASADITFNPQTTLNSIGLWADMKAGIYVDYVVLGVEDHFTIAEAALSGSLILYLQPSKSLTGEVDGSLTVMGITTSTSFNVSYDFK